MCGDIGRNLINGDVLNAGTGSDLHGHVAQKLLERLTAGNEIGFAVDFNQHANAGAGVDIATD